MLKKVFYSKKSGLEVSLGRTVKNGYATGRIFLRVFPLEKGGRDRQIVLKLQPEEAYTLSRYIQAAREANEGIKNAVVHKFTNGDGEEVTTTLSLDCWQREKDGKKRSGFAVVVSRGENKISVPLMTPSFLFLAHMLDRWSVEACFEEKVEEVKPEEEEIPVTEEEEDDFPF